MWPVQVRRLASGSPRSDDHHLHLDRWHVHGPNPQSGRRLPTKPLPTISVALPLSCQDQGWPQPQHERSSGWLPLPRGAPPPLSCPGGAHSAPAALPLPYPGHSQPAAAARAPACTISPFSAGESRRKGRAVLQRIPGGAARCRGPAAVGRDACALRRSRSGGERGKRKTPKRASLAWASVCAPPPPTSKGLQAADPLARPAALSRALRAARAAAATTAAAQATRRSRCRRPSRRGCRRRLRGWPPRRGTAATARSRGRGRCAKRWRRPSTQAWCSRPRFS